MKLLLIDGHYYVYRSFFAIQNLSNSRGEPTNAIFGFTKTLRLMIKHLQPELGAVFWDEGLPAKRVALQPAYKETRKEMPPPMVPQLDFIQEELTTLLGFKNISLPNTEADDLMGCYAIAARKRNIDVVLATNDKDLYQLVGPGVKVYTTAKADLLSPKDTFALLGEPEVTTKWGVPPKLIGDVLALSGDSVVMRMEPLPSCSFTPPVRSLAATETAFSASAKAPRGMRTIFSLCCGMTCEYGGNWASTSRTANWRAPASDAKYTPSAT